MILILKIILSVTFLIFNWLDYYFTKRLLDLGGTEINPVIKYLGLLPVKIASSVLWVLLGWWGHWLFLVPLNAVLCGAWIWNYFQVKKAQKRR
jgi:hypothetical protein